MLKEKPLRRTDIYIAIILFINGIVVILKFGANGIGQLLFNIVLGILLIVMGFTKKPAESQNQTKTLFYTTRMYIFIFLILLVVIVTSNILDSLKQILGL